MSPKERTRKPKPTVTKKDAEELAEQDAEAQAGSPQADLDATDDLLDEIDSLLEEQDVLVKYRQKGGQ